MTSLRVQVCDVGRRLAADTPDQPGEATRPHDQDQPDDSRSLGKIPWTHAQNTDIWPHVVQQFEWTERCEDEHDGRQTQDMLDARPAALEASDGRLWMHRETPVFVMPPPRTVARRGGVFCWRVLSVRPGRAQGGG